MFGQRLTDNIFRQAIVATRSVSVRIPVQQEITSCDEEP